MLTLLSLQIGTVLAPMPVSGLYPAVGLRSENEEVRLLTDMMWESHGDVSMSVDNLDEEWSRLHDVRVNGQLLEYTGCGKSIADVGLAQARHALSTRSHYFELEIMDQGESCYIAIGVARKVSVCVSVLYLAYQSTLGLMKPMNEN